MRASGVLGRGERGLSHQEDVVVKLRGGLGNQLFGWACGYALARRLNVPLQVNDAQISNSSIRLDPRQFELGYFGIQANTQSPRRQRDTILNIKTMASASHIFSEASFNFDARVLDLESPVTLDGYFQSKEYFSEYQGEILRLLTKNANRSKRLDRFSHDLAHDWIAVHIRRGDFLQNSHVHTVPGPAYYRKAADLLRKVTGVHRLVVFSDDIQAAKKMGLDADYYIGAEDLPSPGDSLILMSEAAAFVGSNSSFSWWAAFLSPHINRLNVFPRPWFTSGGPSTRDLLESSWLTLGAQSSSS